VGRHVPLGSLPQGIWDGGGCQSSQSTCSRQFVPLVYWQFHSSPWPLETRPILVRDAGCAEIEAGAPAVGFLLMDATSHLTWWLRASFCEQPLHRTTSPSTQTLPKQKLESYSSGAAPPRRIRPQGSIKHSESGYQHDATRSSAICGQTRRSFAHMTTRHPPVTSALGRIICVSGGGTVPARSDSGQHRIEGGLLRSESLGRKGPRVSE